MRILLLKSLKKDFNSFIEQFCDKVSYRIILKEKKNRREVFRTYEI